MSITPNQIEEKAFEPESYENDGEKIKNRSAADAIALMKFARKKRIPTEKAFRVLGLSAVQLTTPGDEL